MRVNGKSLRKARLDVGLTQEGLAQKLKTNRSTIIKAEQEKQEPGYKLIIKWLDVCGYGVAKKTT